jgi:hypothetical protein
LPALHHDEREESLHAIQFIVVGFVRTDLGIQVLETAGDPTRVARLIVVRQQIARTVAQEPRKLIIVLIDRIGCFIQQSVGFD